MATKHFCDGCDREIEMARDIKRVRVTDVTSLSGETIQNNPRDFELCGGCYGYFTNHSLPTLWSRAADPKAA